MVGIKTLSFAAFAIGALAGPLATTETSKPFKIGITFGQETLYLTNSAISSNNVADGIQCIITTTKSADKSVGTLGCGPDQKKTFTYSEYHTTSPLEPVVADKKNVNWSIGANNVIEWGALPKGSKFVTFSRQKTGNPKNIFAEVCSTFDHHKAMPAVADFWQGGVAKAYFV